MTEDLETPCWVVEFYSPAGEWFPVDGSRGRRVTKMEAEDDIAWRREHRPGSTYRMRLARHGDL